MASKTPLMGLDILNVGQGGDSEVNIFNKLIENFSTLDAHTHTSSDGSAITVGALSIDADLPLNDNSVVGVAGVSFNGIPLTVSADNQSMYVRDGELYWKGAGAISELQITSAGSLNLASLGTIGGDYGGADPALVSYSNLSEEYRFFSNKTDTNTYARMKSSSVSIGPLGVSNPNFFASLVVPASGTSYAITLPDASSDNASQALLSVDGASTLDWVNVMKRGAVSANQIAFVDPADTFNLRGISISASNLLLGTGATPVSGKLTNTYVDNAAAIAGTKISPNFGSQNISTTGDLTVDDITANEVNASGDITSNTRLESQGVLNVLGSSSISTAPSTTLTLGASNSTSTIFQRARQGSSLIPLANSTVDLGSGSRAWRNLYSTTISGGAGGISTTGSVSANGIVTAQLGARLGLAGGAFNVKIAVFTDILVLNNNRSSVLSVPGEIVGLSGRWFDSGIGGYKPIGATQATGGEVFFSTEAGAGDIAVLNFSGDFVLFNVTIFYI